MWDIFQRVSTSKNSKNSLNSSAKFLSSECPDQRRYFKHSLIIQTARSRGYAFLEFEDKDVAQVAASTMNGYIMFGRQLDCHLVDKPHKDIFKNGNRKWQFVPTQVKFRNEKNRERTDEEKAARVKGLLEKEKEKRIRLKELGIEYEFSGYVILSLANNNQAGIIATVKQALLEQAKEEVKAEKKAAAAAPVAKEAKPAVTEKTPSAKKSSAKK